MSDRAISLLIQDCRRMMAREEKAHSAIAGAVVPLSVDPFSRTDSDALLRIRGRRTRSCNSRDAAGSSAITAIDHICGRATAQAITRITSMRGLSRPGR